LNSEADEVINKSEFGPIINAPLLKDKSKYIGGHPIVKSKVKRDFDYKLVTYDNWQLL
jgi:hypothetical protein